MGKDNEVLNYREKGTEVKSPMVILLDSSSLHINYFYRLKKDIIWVITLAFEVHGTKERGFSTSTILKTTLGKTHNSHKSFLKCVYWSNEIINTTAFKSMGQVY